MTTPTQATCIHNWDEPIFDPIPDPEPTLVTSLIERRDCELHPTHGFRQTHTPRWTQTCKKCGKVKHSFTEPC